MLHVASSLRKVISNLGFDGYWKGVFHGGERSGSPAAEHCCTGSRSPWAVSRLASIQLAPAEAREKDPALDRKAALLDQSYYRLLRLVNNLSLAACMTEERPLRLRDQDLVSLVGEYCERAAGAAGNGRREPALCLRTGAAYLCGGQ